MQAPHIFNQIEEDILNHKLELPALPDIALKLKQATHNPDCDLNELAQLIQRDAALVTYLLRLANNPLYRGAQKIDSVSVALNRLGLHATANLAMTYAMHSLYSVEVKVIEDWLKRAWLISTHLAALASVLARHCEGFDPDQALVAAILQDIGTLPLLKKAAAYPAVLADNKGLSRMIEHYCADVGVYILKFWHFDETLIEVARSRKDWLRDPQPQADYADLVLVARLHRYMGTPMAKSLPKLCDIPAYKKLALGKLSARQSLAMLDSAKDEVANIQQMLTDSV